MTSCVAMPAETERNGRHRYRPEERRRRLPAILRASVPGDIRRATVRLHPAIRRATVRLRASVRLHPAIAVGGKPVGFGSARAKQDDEDGAQEVPHDAWLWWLLLKAVSRRRLTAPRSGNRVDGDGISREAGGHLQMGTSPQGRGPHHKGDLRPPCGREKGSDEWASASLRAYLPKRCRCEGSAGGRDAYDGGRVQGQGSWALSSDKL